MQTVSFSLYRSSVPNGSFSHYFHVFKYWKSFWCLVCFTSRYRLQPKPATAKAFVHTLSHAHILYLAHRVYLCVWVCVCVFANQKSRKAVHFHKLLHSLYGAQADTHMHVLLTITKWTKLLSLTPMQVYSEQKSSNISNSISSSSSIKSRGFIACILVFWRFGLFFFLLVFGHQNGRKSSSLVLLTARQKINTHHQKVWGKTSGKRKKDVSTSATIDCEMKGVRKMPTLQPTSQ